MENEAEESLITSFDYSYGELDTDKMTVPVSVKIVPKAVSGNTALVLEFGGRRVEMKKSTASTEFTAEFETGIFEPEDNGAVRLVVTKDGVSETEELDWSLSLLYSDYLPTVISHFAFSDVTYNEKAGILVDGDVISSYSQPGRVDFVSIRLIYKINGEIVAEEDVAGRDMVSVDKVFPGYGTGDIFELYLEAEDELGFTQEKLLKRVEIGGNGEPNEETETVDGEIIIRDKDGKVVYQ